MNYVHIFGDRGSGVDLGKYWGLTSVHSPLHILCPVFILIHSVHLQVPPLPLLL